MSVNSNWMRWCIASIHKHFDDNKQGLTLFIEGMSRTNPTDEDYIELRVDGPSIIEQTKDEYELRFEINVLISSVLDDTDAHRIHRSVGIVVNAFTDISIYKYGDGVADDDSLLGCISLVYDAREKERVVVSHFGQLSSDVPMLQASVEGHYMLELVGG